MMIKECYYLAIEQNHRSLILLIDFLVNEKQVLTFDDDEKELNRYFLDKHKNRINDLLDNYAKTERGKQLMNLN